MEAMIARWIRETIQEKEKAKTNLNLFKMNEMRMLEIALKKFRDELFSKNNQD